jgi:undecaprenyl-diphosphatase
VGWLEALVLGIVQGLTEFLPISSSAHQSIVGQFFGGQDPGSAFTAITQLGTESAVIIFFRKDIWLIIKSWALALIGKLPRNDPEARLGWLVIIGTIPIVVLGLLFQDAIDHGLRNLWTTAAMLAGFGIIIGVIDRVALNARPLAGAIARLDSRRFPIRCDHRRRAGARLPTGRGRQVLLPAGHTSRGWLRALQAR